MLRLIAIAAGVMLAARALGSRRVERIEASPQPAHRLSEEHVEQELRDRAT